MLELDFGKALLHKATSNFLLQMESEQDAAHFILAFS